MEVLPGSRMASLPPHILKGLHWSSPRLWLQSRQSIYAPNIKIKCWGTCVFSATSSSVPSVFLIIWRDTGKPPKPYQKSLLSTSYARIWTSKHKKSYISCQKTTPNSFFPTSISSSLMPSTKYIKWKPKSFECFNSGVGLSKLMSSKRSSRQTNLKVFPWKWVRLSKKCQRCTMRWWASRIRMLRQLRKCIRLTVRNLRLRTWRCSTDSANRC